MKFLSWALLFFSTLAQADVSSFSSLIDSQGNYLTTQSSGSQRPLDIGIVVGGSSIDPRDRNWNTNSLVDSMACSQSGSWTMTANQGTSPWVSNITQFGSSNVVTGTGNSGSGIPRVTVSNDSSITNITGTVSLPTGAATSANQSLLITNTSSVVTNTNSVATRLTDGSQKTQLVNASGAVATFTTIPSPSTVIAQDVNFWLRAANYYCARVPIRQTATSAALTTVWAMRHGTSATKDIYIEHYDLSVGFDAANPLTAQSVFYSLHRFDTATPSGGTSFNENKMDTDSSASQVGDIRYLDTGLTTTGVSFNAAYATLGVPAVRGSVRAYQKDNLALRLKAGEGLAIRVAEVAALIGQIITGEVCWSER